MNWLRNLLDQLRIRNAEIDPNSKCPSCGWRNGSLKCVTVEQIEKPNTTVMVQHTCRICSAVWYEPTILKPEKWVPAELLAGAKQ
jgi:hypothetical protein